MPFSGRNNLRPREFWGLIGTGCFLSALRPFSHFGHFSHYCIFEHGIYSLGMPPKAASSSQSPRG